MLQKEFSFIEAHLSHINEESLNISKANVGWHLDHVLKVINVVSEALKNSNPEEYKRKFNRLRFVIFALGFFPRGKAKSPKRVLPPEIILQTAIENQLKVAIQNLEAIQSLNEHSNFTHPLFQQLNKKQTLKFLKLHTKHHLNIVKDILK